MVVVREATPADAASRFEGHTAAIPGSRGHTTSGNWRPGGPSTGRRAVPSRTTVETGGVELAVVATCKERPDQRAFRET